MARYALPVALFMLMLTALALPGEAVAQTGPELMLKPWGPPTGPEDADRPEARFELSGGLRYAREGEVEANDRDFQLTTYSGEGRYRFSTKRGAPAVGYDLT